MPFNNFNPPFTNKTIQDFFEFPTKYTKDANILKDWILDNYSNLEIGLSYHVLFYI